MAWKVTSYYHRTDPDEAGYSLGNFYEIWGACFDAAGVESVIEVGAERGRLTQELLKWAEPKRRPGDRDRAGSGLGPDRADG